MLHFVYLSQIFMTTLTCMVCYFVGPPTTMCKIWVSLSLISFSILLAFITYKFLVLIRENQKKSVVAKSFLSMFSEADDVIIVDRNMQIVYSKYLHSPTNTLDFEASLAPQFIEKGAPLEMFRGAIFHGTYYEEVLQAHPVAENVDSSHIWVRVLPLYVDEVIIPSHRAIILSDITIHQVDSSTNQSYVTLENYINFAPFGLIYINSQGNIVGANETLCGWLSASRDSFMFKHLSTIIEVEKDKIAALLHSSEPINIKLGVGNVYKISSIMLSTKISENCFIITIFKQNYGEDNNIKIETLKSLSLPSLFINNKDKILVFNEAARFLFKNNLKIGENFWEKADENSQNIIKNFLCQSSDIIKPLELEFFNNTLAVRAYINKYSDDRWLVQLVNMSEQKRVEQQFIQSQKTQAVGQLAGGIAHDFNNLLTAIIGFCDLLLQKVVPNDPSYNDIMQIKQNANRASNLVKQLLAFSRRQSLQPRKINLKEILFELSSLLKRLIGSQITFKMNYNKNLWPVKVDVNQFEQVVVNIVVNARDAVSENGDIVIDASNYTNTDSKIFGNEVLLPGDYVLIKISDNGCGIPEKLQNSIFEPFFSTKEVGQGTGLGLATAYGIVKQTGGIISVESIVGKGSTFKIFLPRCYEKDVVSHRQDTVVSDITGCETVLLVEDEDAVRIFAGRALRDRGYRVLEASDGEEALNIVNNGEKPDVLITDLSMPKIDGSTLSKNIKKIIPDLPVIFTSGYAKENFRDDLLNDKSIHFLPKPFTIRDLATKIRLVVPKN